LPISSVNFNLIKNSLKGNKVDIVREIYSHEKLQIFTGLITLARMMKGLGAIEYSLYQYISDVYVAIDFRESVTSYSLHLYFVIRIFSPLFFFVVIEKLFNLYRSL